ncbi:hypothetical protein ACHAXA_011707 [Cyclostephanos tholiformis]|uniref:Uncharacterized protein n=1 Tax=Cyclostephanos tholiformis TaxID=382380 RepID=A0ABD3R069_9STRA
MKFPAAPSGPPGQPIDGDCVHNRSNGNGNGRLDPPPLSPAALGEHSYRRRELLKKFEQPPIKLSNHCPIERYYASADRVLAQFKSHLAKQELDDAYVIGRRFALFSTVSLPNHDYYKSPKAGYVQLRLKNQEDAQWVTRGLERIVEVMDKEEIEKQFVEAERLMKQKEEEVRQQLEWEKSIMKRLGSIESSSFGLDSDDGTFDTASKLELLNLAFPRDEDIECVLPAPPATPIAPSTTPSAPSFDEPLPPLPPPVVPPHMGLLISTSATQQLKSDGATPFFPESPPAYNDLFLESLRTSSITAMEEAELAELEKLPPKPKPVPRAPIREIQRDFENHLQSLLSTKQIEILKLDTFQGRLSASSPRYDSTNGCAVISPLIVATHISTSNKEYGISNSAINEIIDKRAPPILQKVRSKLGLAQHALIIPSDVHDYLVDENLLPQDKFVGVCGGDILNDDHIAKLIEMLVFGKEKGNRPRKVGAALFFMEHVVSIIQIPLGNGECYYDLIDSLPSSFASGMATRTRCKDLASFEILLKRYGSSKLRESQCDFIDDNEWNVEMCDFDPRTFQGFVWCES